MSQKYPGGIINKTAPVTVGPVDGEGGSAPGVWTLEQALALQKQGLWPKPVLPKELYAWGSNSYGQLGLNNTSNRSSPVQVGALTDWSRNLAVSSYFTSFAIKTDGALWGWGRNSIVGTGGMIGDGTVINRSSPVQIGSDTDWYQVEGGFAQTFAIRNNNTLWSWGINSDGRLGQNNTINRSSPVQIGALTNWLSVSGDNNTAFAIKTNGQLWGWGSNYKGRLGVNYSPPYGVTDERSSPVQVGSDTSWYEVSSSGNNTAAIKANGTLWTWGVSLQGQSGRNTGGVYAYLNGISPVQVGGDSTWAQVSVGFCCAAIKTDGTLWAWGANNHGQLGDNTAINRSSPIQVGSSTDWSFVSAGQVGFCVALKTNGTLWAWGYNVTGGLGLGNTANRSSPVQIGALTTWSAISAAGRGVIAIKTT